MTTKVKSMLKEIEALERRLEHGIPADRDKFSKQIDRLQEERRPHFIAAAMKDDDEAAAEVARLDGQIAKLQDKLQALDMAEVRVTAEIKELRKDYTSLQEAMGMEIDSELKSLQNDIVTLIESHLFEISQKLGELKDVSNRRHNLAAEYDWTRPRYAEAAQPLAAKAVLCLGRIGKMNLNSIITSTAYGWFEAMLADKARGIPQAADTHPTEEAMTLKDIKEEFLPETDLDELRGKEAEKPKLSDLEQSKD